ncbi:MAG TPA: peptidoglycan-binding protein [Acidimicrobiia bacterium]
MTDPSGRSGPESTLRPGGGGEAVRDLQRRLVAAGFDIPAAELGRFGPLTEQALRAFQERRALRVDGVCDRETWNALVESSFRLGDRMLYVRRPMLHGDDVADLQRRLNRLGFDAGKEDGIFGPETAGALTEFQRNIGIGADGILGPDTTEALDRLGERHVAGMPEGSVASVREREELRRGPHRLAGRRVFVAVSPGFAVLGDRVCRGLAAAGVATALDASGTDDSALAAAANGYDADFFLGLRPGDEVGCGCSYFESGAFRSEAGYRVAVAVADALGAVLGVAPRLCGRRTAALRETRMAAVLCEPVAHDDVAATRRLVTSTAAIADAIVAGIRRGVEEPIPEP